MVKEMQDETNRETIEQPHIEHEFGIQAEPRKRNFLPLWILIVVLLILGVFGWYHWFFNRAPEAPVTKKAVKVVPEALPEPEPEPVVELTEGQKKFNKIFTDSLLKNALENAGEGFDLAMFRNMIRIAMNAEFLGDRPGMTWEKWEKERTKVQEMARHELSDPVFLKMLWNRYGSIVVEAVKASGKSAQVKQLCLKAIPYFSGELSHSRFVQLDNYYKTDKKLEREIQKRKYSKEAIRALTQKLDEKYRSLKGAGLDDTDIYFFEFSMRRIHEGGRDLAKSYGEILLDLKARL